MKLHWSAWAAVIGVFVVAAQLVFSEPPQTAEPIDLSLTSQRAGETKVVPIGRAPVDVWNSMPRSMLQQDNVGRLLFFCRTCPKQMCKHLACSFEFIQSGPLMADCECREEKR